MVWGAISYNYRSPLIRGCTGKRVVQAYGYLEQVLEPVVAPDFQGLLGYECYKAKQEVDGKWCLYVEDHAPAHGTKKVLVEAKGASKFRYTNDCLLCRT
jgi:hypothetical protein